MTTLTGIPYNGAPRAEERVERISFGGVFFANLTLDEALQHIDALVERGGPSLVVTPNVDHVIRARRDAAFAEILRSADLVLADGQPIVWACRLLDRPLKQRVAGSDLLPALCAHASRKGYRMFFFGGEPGSAEAARDRLQRNHPGLNVVGTYCPPIGFEECPQRNAAALDAVKAAAADILLVGLGSPKQERWIVAHMHEYRCSVSIGVGISFSFVSGHVKRAPRWMRRSGLEWLHRLWMEPRRLWYRYLVRGWAFLPIFMGEAVGALANRRIRSERHDADPSAGAESGSGSSRRVKP